MTYVEHPGHDLNILSTFYLGKASTGMSLLLILTLSMYLQRFYTKRRTKKKFPSEYFVSKCEQICSDYKSAHTDYRTNFMTRTPCVFIANYERVSCIVLMCCK